MKDIFHSSTIDTMEDVFEDIDNRTVYDKNGDAYDGYVTSKVAKKKHVQKNEEEAEDYRVVGPADIEEENDPLETTVDPKSAGNVMEMLLESLEEEAKHKVRSISEISPTLTEFDPAKNHVAELSKGKMKRKSCNPADAVTKKQRTAVEAEDKGVVILKRPIKRDAEVHFGLEENFEFLSWAVERLEKKNGNNYKSPAKNGARFESPDALSYIKKMCNVARSIRDHFSDILDPANHEVKMHEFTQGLGIDFGRERTPDKTETKDVGEVILSEETLRKRDQTPVYSVRMSTCEKGGGEVTIYTVEGGKEVDIDRAHLYCLMSVSPVFSALLTSDMIEGKTKRLRMEASNETVKVFIYLIYYLCAPRSGKYHLPSQLANYIPITVA